MKNAAMPLRLGFWRGWKSAIVLPLTIIAMPLAFTLRIAATLDAVMLAAYDELIHWESR